LNLKNVEIKLSAGTENFQTWAGTTPKPPQINQNRTDPIRSILWYWNGIYTPLCPMKEISIILEFIYNVIV